MRIDNTQLYTCPMHPKVIKDTSGMCPQCGMQLVPTKGKKEKQGKKEQNKEQEDFDRHEGHEVNIFKTRFWISFILSIPIVLYAEVTQDLLNYEAPVFYGSAYMPLILASIVFFYGGSIFITSAFRELRAKMPGMMTLITLAISTAYIYSVYVVFTGIGKTLFWELTTLIAVMLLGHWMEMRAVSGAQGALKELSKLLPDSAEVIREGNTITVPLGEIRIGDLVLIKPGGKISADGIVKDGISDVDESVITGESKPIAKKQGDEVIAGTTNGDGSLKIEVTKIGDDTFLAGVMKLVAEAQASKSHMQMLSDRAAYYLTIIAIMVGSITFVTWLSLAETAFAVERMVAVLVITCPHALGLAIPLVASISTTKAAKNGFLVKQRLSLEAARNIDVVLFDKTGTLTLGEFGIDSVITGEGNSREEVLLYAASVNSHSEHPIASAMTKQAKEEKISLLDIKDFKIIPGKGVRAYIDNKSVFVGSRELVDEQRISLDENIKTEVEKLTGHGKTINFVIVDKQIIGAIALVDIVREESRDAVQELHDMGVKTAMITGDAEDVAKWVADELDIDQYFARVIPNQKAEKVKALQADGKKVAMVGDGVNDAPALAQADLGIAIGAGTNVALESAGIILVKNDPRDIPKVIRLSKLTYTKMIQNLFWATGYNVVAIPLAAGVLAFRGIWLQPALAALLMSLSTVIVAVNAMFLRKRIL